MSVTDCFPQGVTAQPDGHLGVRAGLREGNGPIPGLQPWKSAGPHTAGRAVA